MPVNYPPTSNQLISQLNQAAAANHAAYTAHTHTLTDPGHSHYAGRLRKRLTLVGVTPGGRGHGQPMRTPRVDILLAKCIHTKRFIQEQFFNHLLEEQAIEILGDYNPLYGGRPKRLTRMLLDAVPAAVRKEYNMDATGLFYMVPCLIGVRATRMRTSYAGLALLDHWASKFPKFANFLKCYDSKRARSEITSECFDLSQGYRPASFKAIDKKNELYQLKADSRELKRLKEEEARLARRTIVDHNASLIAMSQAQYQSALNSTSVHQHGWSSTISTGGTGGTLGGIIGKTV